MHWRQAGLVTLIGAFLVASIVGCNRPLKEQVVGTWKGTDGNSTITFLKDGTCTMSGGPFTVTGKYTTPDEKHLKIELSGIAGNLVGTQVRETEVKDGKLVLTENGKRSEYTRVP